MDRNNSALCVCVDEERRPLVKPALLTLTSPGHWLPMSCLALHLRDRGHQPVFFCLEDAAGLDRGMGPETIVLGRETMPRGATPDFIARLAKLKGLAAVRFTVHHLTEIAEMQMRELPALRAEAAWPRVAWL